MRCCKVRILKVSIRTDVQGVQNSRCSIEDVAVAESSFLRLRMSCCRRRSGVGIDYGATAVYKYNQCLSATTTSTNQRNLFPRRCLHVALLLRRTSLFYFSATDWSAMDGGSPVHRAEKKGRH
ncbi:unnamed protein product, partial [Ectocarpus sp. 4 AP-2014]